MRLRWLNILLLMLVAVCLGVSWTARRDFRRPNVDFLPDMVYSPAYRAQSPNPNFKDGKTMQPPVRGTIACGQTPLHYQPTAGDAVRAGRELQNPLNCTDPAIVERGASVFASFCQHCHGAGGLGDGPVSTRGFPPPPSLLAEHAIEMPDGQMFHVLTYGQGNMPSHANLVDVADRWKVICYIRSLQKPSTESREAPGTRPATGTSLPGGNAP